MKRAIWEIQFRSISAAVTHLRLLDLDEVAKGAKLYGTPENAAFIAAVAAALQTLPGGPHG